MSLVWEFQVDGVFHEAEWSDGSMRCTIPTVQSIVDRLIAEGYKLPCGSGVIMVEPNLDNEAGAYAVISEAVFLVADFQTILNPQSEATIGDDLIFPDANDIEKASFKGDRSAAAQYAARIRWGNRGKGQLTDEEFVAQIQGEVQSIGDDMRTLLGVDENGLMREPTVGVFNSVDEIDDSHVLWENPTTNEFEASPQLADLHDRTLAVGWQMTERAQVAADKRIAEGDYTNLQKEQILAEENMKLVGMIRPVGGERFTEFGGMSPDSEFGSMLGDVSQKFPNAWVSDARTHYTAKASLEFQVAEGVGPRAGGSFGRSGNNHRIQLTLADDGPFDEKTALSHEFGHMMDTVRPSSVTLSHAFMAYRTRTNSTGESRSGETLSSLTQTTPRKKFSRDGVENGHFKTDYMGTVYTTGGRRRVESSEILTMSYEFLVGGRGYVPDKEHRAFAVGVLATA